MHLAIPIPQIYCEVSKTIESSINRVLKIDVAPVKNDSKKVVSNPLKISPAQTSRDSKSSSTSPSEKINSPRTPTTPVNPRSCDFTLRPEDRQRTAPKKQKISTSGSEESHYQQSFGNPIGRQDMQRIISISSKRKSQSVPRFGNIYEAAKKYRK